MTDREELARVLYEAPFALGTSFTGTWPPSHPDDREWWLTRADAVLASDWLRKHDERTESDALMTTYDQ